MCQREKRSCNGNKKFPAARSMLQRERYYRLSRSRSYNGNLRRKPNKQKKPVPEMTPGRALLCLRKPKTLEYQGFQVKRKCTVILSKLPCIGGKSDVRGYNAPSFDGMVHYFMGSILIHRGTADGKDSAIRQHLPVWSLTSTHSEISSIFKVTTSFQVFMLAVYCDRSALAEVKVMLRIAFSLIATLVAANLVH